MNSGQTVKAGGAIVVGAILLFFMMMAATDPGDNIVLVESSLGTGQSGDRVATGTVENKTDRDYSRIQVAIDLLNNDGRVVGSTTAATDVLTARQTWTFEAPVTVEDATTFRVKITSPDNVRQFPF